MKQILYMTMAAITAIIAACTEDIDLTDTIDTTGVLCVNGFLYSDCDTNSLYITKTGISKPQIVNDATVKIFVNGQLTEQISGSKSNNGSYRLSKSTFSPGDIVRVEIEHDGQHIWSENTAPQYIKDLDVRVTLTRGKNLYDHSDMEFVKKDLYKVELCFTDLSPDLKYYRLYTYKDAYRKFYYENYDAPLVDSSVIIGRWIRPGQRYNLRRQLTLSGKKKLSEILQAFGQLFYNGDSQSPVLIGFGKLFRSGTPK